MGFENSGRRPKPTAIHILNGNPSRKKLNKNEPRPPAGDIVKPEWLSAATGAIWDEVAPICLAMGTLTTADVFSLVCLCGLQATMRRNEQTRGTEGFSERLERDTAIALRPYYELFGLTPSARARLVVPNGTDEPVSKWAGVLK